MEPVISSKNEIMNVSRTLTSIKASVSATLPEVPRYQCFLKVDFSSAQENFARNNPEKRKICESDRVIVMCEYNPLNFEIVNINS